MSANDPFRSGTQKFLNVRLYGQGIALAALFGTIGLGSIAAQQQRHQQEEAAIEGSRLYSAPHDDMQPSSLKQA